MQKLLYIAGKYSGSVDENIDAAKQVAIAIFQSGHYALCPHMATGKMDEATGITDVEFWYAATLKMLERCDGIVMVPGWEESRGAVMEHKWATANALPIWYFPDLRELPSVN